MKICRATLFLVAAFPSACGKRRDAFPPEGELQTSPAEKISNPVAIFSGLDKITGGIVSFDVYIDETVQFASAPGHAARLLSRPGPRRRFDAFVEVDEITLDRKVRRICSAGCSPIVRASTPSTTPSMTLLTDCHTLVHRREPLSNR